MNKYQDNLKLQEADFSDLKGKVLTSIENNENEDIAIIFYCDSGDVYYLFYEKDPEDVFLFDIIGNFDNIINTPILSAKVTTEGDSISLNRARWRIFRLSTINGSLEIEGFESTLGSVPLIIKFVKAEVGSKQ